MKKTFHLLIVMMMLFLYTWSKDDGFVTDSSRQDDLLKKANKGVITVLPSGGDDTQVIKDAFAAAKEAGRGSVVQLDEVVFKIGFIEIRDLYGYFQGAVIENIPG